MKPMLAHVYEPHRVTYPCYVQPKFNGVRAVCGTDVEGRRRFQSRDELPWNYNVLRHISEALDFLPKDLVLDGEIYRHGWPLQKIVGACAVARSEPSEDTAGLVYVIFDVVDYTKSFQDRFFHIDFMENLSTPGPYAKAKTVRVTSSGAADDFYATMIHEGFEGIMYRVGDCLYTVPKQQQTTAYVQNRLRFLSDKNNRTWHVLKRKSWLDGEFEITHVVEGIGKRSGMTGAFRCVTKEGKAFFVGSGLSDHEAIHYWQNSDAIARRRIKVKFQTLTSDGIPFHPTFEQLL